MHRIRAHCLLREKTEPTKPSNRGKQRHQRKTRAEQKTHRCAPCVHGRPALFVSCGELSEIGRDGQAHVERESDNEEVAGVVHVGKLAEETGETQRIAPLRALD